MDAVGVVAVLAAALPPLRHPDTGGVGGGVRRLLGGARTQGRGEMVVRVSLLPSKSYGPVPALRHGDTKTATDSLLVCAACGTRIVTGDVMVFDMRPPYRHGGFRVAPKPKWVHEECLSATGDEHTRHLF